MIRLWVPVAAVLAVLLCTCIVSSLATSNDPSPSQPGGPTSNKTPSGKPNQLWSVDLGLYKLESYFKEQNYVDKLRLSKDHYKFQVVNKLNPSRDPPVKIKATRVEELVKCAVDLPDEVECLPLSQHRLGVNSSAPALRDIDSSEALYARIRKYRIVTDGELVATPIRITANIYPLRAYHVREHLTNLVIENQLGKPGDHSLGDDSIDGFYYEMDASFGDVLVQDCTAFGYQSFNDTHTHENVLHEILQQGVLVDLKDMDCSWDTSSIFRYVTNFRIAYQHEFPYLFVHHSMKTQPLDLIFNYEALVKQTKAADQTDTEAYNTTVNIKSTSAFIEFLNFKLDQTISNEDSKTGSETAQLLSSYLDILVNSSWTENEFLKQFKFLDLLNVTYSNYFNEDGVKLLLDIKKTLLGNLYQKNEKYVHDEL